MAGTIQPISTSILGLKGFDVFVAHAKGNWGPGNDGSDCRSHPMQLSLFGDRLQLSPAFLTLREEFKLVVPGVTPAEAIAIYNTRVQAGVHRGLRFDCDCSRLEKRVDVWLLADRHDVIRFGEQNQANMATTSPV